MRSDRPEADQEFFGLIKVGIKDWQECDSLAATAPQTPRWSEDCRSPNPLLLRVVWGGSPPTGVSGGRERPRVKRGA
jgi:hypothetical protein